MGDRKCRDEAQVRDNAVLAAFEPRDNAISCAVLPEQEPASAAAT